MQAANKYAGYTLGEADILRRAMSKKKLELLKTEETKFLEKVLNLIVIKKYLRKYMT